MKISATIITFNEEKHIKECISSLLPVADEVIVVDSFSNDKTAEICKSFKEVSFFQQTFKGYGQQKNDALEKCKGDYILSLDADERLSEKLSNEISKLKETGPLYEVYKVSRINNYYGHWMKHSGEYPDYKIRFWKKGSVSWSTSSVHEKAVVESSNIIGKLDGDILHYTTSSLYTHVAQVNKFSDLAADGLIQSGSINNAILKMLLDPPFIFVKKYIVKLGFLDGFAGFTNAIISAHSKFLKYAKYIQKKRSNNQ
jgi:glycosyltransferase involved in cell wall biosynthesis